MRPNGLCAHKLLMTAVLSLLGAPLLPAQGVLAWHNDAARTGQNPTGTLDGEVDAHPLYVPSVSISGVVHNVVYVATENDTVYALDADSAGSPLWQQSVLSSGETASDNRGCDNLTPKMGIVATPAIALATGPKGTIYVVAMSKDGSGNYYHRLHA